MTSHPAPAQNVRICFDFISPYAYLAWTQIHRIATAAGHNVEPMPVLFAALLDAHGTKGPAEVPARRAYVIKDAARLAHAFGVPIDAPPVHPFNPLLALRLASLPLPPEKKRALIDALFAAAWQRCQNLADPAVVAAAATAAGIPPECLDEAATPEAKSRLRAQTDEAIAAGAFGVPTVFVRGEMFFGCDSLPHLERYLHGEDPVPRDLLERWQNLPAGATRRQ
jgi:2-hydroxychromene-2-carboxylate isomerase